MIRTLLLLLVLFPSARPARAQVYMGAELSPGAFLKDEEAKLDRGGDDAFARAFALDSSTSSLYSVFESTAPEIAVSSWLRRGVYRSELLMLFSIAESTRASFTPLAREREKGVTIRELAARYAMDPVTLFKRAAARQEELEARAALAGGVPAPDLSTGTVSVPELSTAPAANKNDD